MISVGKSRGFYYGTLSLFVGIFGALFHKLWWFGGIKASQARFGLCIFVLLRGFIKNENEISVWKNLREHRENGGFL